MLDYHQALQSLLEELPILAKEKELSLLQAVGHVLAQDIITHYDTPRFDNSAMDGYALGGDLDNCREWRIVERIIAGDTGQGIELKTGEAVRIFTGAPTPKGTSAVVMQENTKQEGDLLTVLETVVPMQHIRHQAEEFTKDSVLLKAGQRLTPAMIAIAASQGYSKLPVYRSLTITVLSTGNELLNPEEPLVDGKIYDANRFLLLSWLQQFGHEIVDGGILLDDQTLTEQALMKATEYSDVIITSGGVSVGEEDHIRTAIATKGRLVNWRLAIKPGKPFAWGEIGNTKVFMLPGNPVASLVTFQQMVIPALRRLMGENMRTVMPYQWQAKASFSITRVQSRREFLRVKLTTDGSGSWVDILPNQGSAMLSTCVNADALAEVPPQTAVVEGDLLTIYPLLYKV